jgi:hypothetical protein
LLLGLLLFVLLDPALVVHLDLVVACIRLRQPLPEIRLR